MSPLPDISQYDRVRRVVGASVLWHDPEVFDLPADGGLDGPKFEPFRVRKGDCPPARVRRPVRAALRRETRKTGGAEGFEPALLDYCAVMSEAQLNGDGVNTPVPVVGEPFPVRRPPGYGRVVVVATPWGELDVKGAGVGPGIRPTTAQHGTGLLDLPSAIVELCTERLARQALAPCGIETVRCAALILLPVDTTRTAVSGGGTPCALLVRKAYPRVNIGPDHAALWLPVFEFARRCEAALRQVGLTSTSVDIEVTLASTNGHSRVRIGKADAPGAFADALAALLERQGIGSCETLDFLNVQFCLDRHRQKLMLVDFGGMQHCASSGRLQICAAVIHSPRTPDAPLEALDQHAMHVRRDGRSCVMSLFPPLPPVGHHPLVHLLGAIGPDGEPASSATARVTKPLANLIMERLAQDRSPASLRALVTHLVDRFAVK